MNTNSKLKNSIDKEIAGGLYVIVHVATHVKYTGAEQYKQTKIL